jgi:hypothetical protein
MLIATLYLQVQRTHFKFQHIVCMGGGVGGGVTPLLHDHKTSLKKLLFMFYTDMQNGRV